MQLTRCLSSIVVVLAISIAGPVAADHSHDKPKGGQAKESREERLKKVRIETLKKEVGLDEKKAKEADKILEKYAPERRKLRRNLREQRKMLRALLDKKSDDQGAYEKALKATREDTRKLSTLSDDQFDAFSKLLTPKEHAKLAKATGQLNRKVRDADGDRRDDDDDNDHDFEI